VARDLARPPGTRDYVGDHAQVRAVACAELAKLFECWGYDRIETPCLEYAQTLSRGLHRDDARLLRLIDRDGQVLAVRSEMTTPVARVVSRLAAGSCERGAEGPLTRLFYMEKTYARGDRDGSIAEVTQCGIELIGDASADADAQVIAILLQAMDQLGVRDAAVVVGHIGFVNALLAQVGLGAADRLRSALAAKDLVGFRAMLATADVSADRRSQLERLLTLSTTRDGELLEAVALMADCPDVRKSAEQLEALFAALRDHGYVGRVVLDLTLYLDHDYYTGPVFEGYGRGAGQPLCFGGRYDGLVGELGERRPATGGALNLERALEVSSRPLHARPRIELHHDALRRSEAYAFGRFLRRAGFETAVECIRADTERPVATAAASAPAEVATDIGLPGLGVLVARLTRIDRAQLMALFEVFVRERAADTSRAALTPASERGEHRAQRG